MQMLAVVPSDEFQHPLPRQFDVLESIRRVCSPKSSLLQKVLPNAERFAPELMRNVKNNPVCMARGRFTTR